MAPQDDDDWRFPSVEVVNFRTPDGQSRPGVVGATGYVKSYLARFNVVPAMQNGRRKLVVPIVGGGWDVLEPEACPELCAEPQQIRDPGSLRKILIENEWQLVGYTVNRTLIRLFFDASGEGFWQIAKWGHRDVSPEHSDGYFEFDLSDRGLAATWPNGEVTTYEIDVVKKLIVTGTLRGELAFSDYELTADRHIVPPEVHDLDGWPLTYWGAPPEESEE